MASFRPAADPIGRGDVWFGSAVTVENYLRAWSLAPFGQYYINTIVVVGLILAVQVVTITLAGFAFAHYQLGIAYYEWNELETAQSHLEENLTLRFHAHEVSYHSSLQ